MRGSHATSTLKVAAVAVLALPACTPEVPAVPTYARDVQPIFMARCVRCHGANDTLNQNPDVTGAIKAPTTCYLQRFADEGDCSMTGPQCKHGAGYCGTQTGSKSLIETYLELPQDALGMPPPPSDRLSSWEMDVITRWTSANPVQ
jgi:hypothetical protein